MGRRAGAQLAALFALLVLGSACGATDAAEPPSATCGADDRTLRVMTFNIRTGLGTRNPGKNPLHQLLEPHDVAPIVAAIRAADADVVAMQEVLGPGQAREIAAALNMQSHFAYHPSPIPWWGNAILSKCALQNTGRVVTSHGAGNGKAMAVAQIEVAGQSVRLTSLHRDRDDNTGAQVERFLQPFEALDSPVILMGDFNFTPKDARYEAITAPFEDSVVIARDGGAYVQERGTYPVTLNKKPGRRIDFVFLSSGDFGVEVARLMQGEHALASDHLGYVAQVRLKAKEK